MRISIIAAMGQNFVIGDDKGLPWRLPADLKRFRQLTMGKPLILGRKTLELIGKPLPGRENIVLTRRTDYAPPGVRVAHSVEEALRFAAKYLAKTGGDEVMVIGGEEVYRQFLTRADRYYLTIVEGLFAGAATFPRPWYEGRRWRVAHSESIPADDANMHGSWFYLIEETAVATEMTLPAVFAACQGNSTDSPPLRLARATINGSAE